MQRSEERVDQTEIEQDIQLTEQRVHQGAQLLAERAGNDRAGV